LAGNLARNEAKYTNFPANLPVANVLKTHVRLPLPLHGMEKVVGSIS